MISGFINPLCTRHSTDILGELCRVLKPQGKLYLQELVATQGQGEGSIKSKDKLVSTLKISGFINVSQVNITLFHSIFTTACICAIYLDCKIVFSYLEGYTNKVAYVSNTWEIQHSEIFKKGFEINTALFHFSPSLPPALMYYTTAPLG